MNLPPILASFPSHSQLFFRKCDLMRPEIKKIYQNYPQIPYINPQRDLNTWLKDLKIGKAKLVPKRNMETTPDGLLPGDLILLWRIAFGTFTNKSWFPKYFEYDYGIDAPSHLQNLLDQGYAYIESPFQSLDHITAAEVKNILKKHGIKGYSKLKRDQLDQLLQAEITEAELDQEFTVRGLALTEKGQTALDSNPDVIDRHPKKKY